MGCRMDLLDFSERVPEQLTDMVLMFWVKVDSITGLGFIGMSWGLNHDVIARLTNIIDQF